ncbi:MAG: DUF1801 domain-containing protein [Saprospiraceae bacterium]|nr:DUF1801 domain-containing protein [Saprospiraceae bacterium]
MQKMNPLIDAYLAEGCGRCPLGGTPDCKVHKWPEALEHLRRIALDCGLTEALKWGVPCYTFEGNNIAIVSAFKEYCAISFFKGALLSDVHGILSKPGENTQAGRLVRFTDVGKIIELETVLKEYIFEAIEIEKAGLKVDFSQQKIPIPEEFNLKMTEMPDLKAAFFSLTPGRQKAYLLHFSAPKQSKTRMDRIEKCIGQILEGKGFHESKYSTTP